MAIDSQPEPEFIKTKAPWQITLLFLILGFAITKLTQSIIGEQIPPSGLIIDRLQIFTKSINEYFLLHKDGARFVLITTSIWFDFCCIFLSLKAVFGSSVRPYLALFMFLIYRQGLQLLVSLPIPQNIIWFYPGLPSLLVDYSAQGDLYFSAHTGVSLLCAIELARFKKSWLTVLGFFFFAYEVATLICFRIHYTMDIFTAVFVVLYVVYRSEKLAPKVDNFLGSFLRTAKE